MTQHTETHEGKLAICINALRAIAGDPANDSLIEARSGINPGQEASVRRARQALVMVGVSLAAPISGRADQ
ncbi:hypothetical protein [Neorhizobium sp. SOG26]|uniref:hypothetical protein n=1 Tax=Neorhizobium sp. SOG26 TaxID=2060726 RepID=UPI000E56A052|nr:hypothetical protein [Neorhizobium sp. SOG26]